ncbi:hypothetical protein K2173_027652 [Erythroxylum novogranatense]|uniref:Uncharacterized protein n=1 Tax=Erythroxylum novogranatense TaxID=1862640 RepID=A0AAV8U270_9ROSI|nr:hypothetical protein K2173_027652 [Erythroxylum novogranatense]
MTFAGSLSLVSLASILLPEPLRVALYAFYSLVLVAESYSYGTFHNLYCWIRIVKEKLVNGFGDQNRERLPVPVEVVNRSTPNDGLSHLHHIVAEPARIVARMYVESTLECGIGDFLRPAFHAMVDVVVGSRLERSPKLTFNEWKKKNIRTS